MNKTNYRRLLGKTHLAVSLVPWATLAYFTVYAFTLRFFVGYWPHYDGPPPDWSPLLGRFGLPVQHIFWWGGEQVIKLLALSLPAWLIVLCVRFCIDGLRAMQQVWRASIVFLLGWVILFLLVVLDPVGFVGWWGSWYGD